MSYSISEEKKKQFAGLYLLERMINKPEVFDILLENNDADLEPILEYLLAKSLIRIEKEKLYVPSEQGRETIVKFTQKYQDFLRNFDIFCAVDLGEGRFAFEEYFELKDGEWSDYLNQDIWEDLRVAVAEFKGVDLVEIVFMSFIHEERFGFDEKSGWQFDLLLGSVWDEILNICNSALTIKDLAYLDGDTEVSGEDVIKDVITQGAKLNHHLWQREDYFQNRYDNNDDSNHPDRYVDPVHGDPQNDVVYQCYYNPFYISPVWGLLLFV